MNQNQVGEELKVEVSTPLSFLKMLMLSGRKRRLGFYLSGEGKYINVTSIYPFIEPVVSHVLNGLVSSKFNTHSDVIPMV